MRTKGYEKDPDDVLDYTLDWSKYLANLSNDTISTSTWSEDSGGITIDSSTNTTTKSTVFLSGGNEGEQYTVENLITTAGGRTVKRAIVVEISELTSKRSLYDYI